MVDSHAARKEVGIENEGCGDDVGGGDEFTNTIAMRE